jgi:hypothetical protein
MGLFFFKLINFDFNHCKLYWTETTENVMNIQRNARKNNCGLYEVRTALQQYIHLYCQLHSLLSD